MKHRAGSSKIKYEHHMIQGLRAFLEQIEEWDEIKTIIPGRIESVKFSRPFSLNVQYNTITGVKCIVRSGTAVQEVFIVTANPGLLKKHFGNFLQKF